MHDFGLGDQLCWPEPWSTLVNAKALKNRRMPNCTQFESNNGLIETTCWPFEDSHSRVEGIATACARISVST